jgi:hypothetical protein
LLEHSYRPSVPLVVRGAHSALAGKGRQRGGTLEEETQFLTVYPAGLRKTVIGHELVGRLHRDGERLLDDDMFPARRASRAGA